MAAASIVWPAFLIFFIVGTILAYTVISLIGGSSIGGKTSSPGGRYRPLFLIPCVILRRAAY